MLSRFGFKFRRKALDSASSRSAKPQCEDSTTEVLEHSTSFAKPEQSLRDNISSRESKSQGSSVDNGTPVIAHHSQQASPIEEGEAMQPSQSEVDKSQPGLEDEAVKAEGQFTEAHSPTAPHSEALVAYSVPSCHTPDAKAEPIPQTASSDHGYHKLEKSPSHISDGSTEHQEPVERSPIAHQPRHSLDDDHPYGTVREKGTKSHDQPKLEDEAAEQTLEDPIVANRPQNHHGSDSRLMNDYNKSGHDDPQVEAEPQTQTPFLALETERHPSSESGHTTVKKEDNRNKVIAESYKALPLLHHTDELSSIPNPHSTTYTPSMSARIAHKVDKILAADAKARTHDERHAEKHAARDVHQRAKEEAKAASDARRAKDKEEEQHRHADQRADREARKREKEAARIRKEEAKRKRRAQGGISWGFEPLPSKHHHAGDGEDDDEYEDGVEVGAQDTSKGCTGHGHDSKRAH